MAARPTTPASPKNTNKVKPPVPGVPMYGCEHIQRLLTQSQELMNTCVGHYKMSLRTIFDNTPIVPQTSKNAEGRTMTSLTSTYLCLQCPTTVSEEDRLKHGTKKQHRFYVDSRSGALYCQMCDDFIWDPTFEDLRVRKIGTGSFINRKRKHDDLFADSVKEDLKFFSANTNALSCKTNGLRGIYNAGATCYQNVVLQSFLHNPLLRNYYLSDGHHSGSCMVPSCLSCAMDTTFQDFYAVENTNGYTAAAILSSFWFSDRKAFSNLVTTREQDAHEFFQFLAEELHERNGGGQQASNGEANGRPRSSSQGNDQAPSQSTTGSEHNCNCIIHQTFYGKLQRSTTCMTCHGVTNTVESFLDLSLGFDQVAKKNKKSTGAKGGTSSGAISLKDCLDDEYIKPTQCEYRCHKCNATRQARRSTSIKLLPNVLSIQLKRFEFRQGKRGGDRVASKVDREVQFPLQLNMMPYTSRAKAAAASQQHQQDGSSGPVRDTTYELARSCTYDLLSVVVHVGSIETGHYISYCRMGDQWFMFNDHKVEVASKSDVLNAQAYLLFYIVRSLA